jgi:hypothetical protein
MEQKYLTVLFKSGELRQNDESTWNRNIALWVAIWSGIESIYRRNSEDFDRIWLKNLFSPFDEEGILL